MNRFLFTLILVTGSQSAVAGPAVNIVVGPDAPKLERFAAQELAEQFKQIFAAEVTVADKLPAKGQHLIVLGSPQTNPAVKELAGDRWPKLSDQGHVLRSVKRGDHSALVVGGGSPVATLWAAYELGHHFGIRPFPHSDVMPARLPELRLDGIDIVLEPTLRLRAFQTLGDSPTGFETWGLEDQQRLVRQLAKLKFNRIVLAMHPWQPFAHFEFKDVKKSTGVLALGQKIRVDGDTAGRRAFRGAKEFGNADLLGKNTYEERVKAATELGRGIIDAAHEVGMSAAIALPLLEFPKEFAPLLRNAQPVPRRESFSIRPDPGHAPEDAALLGLTKAQIKAHCDTYPAADALHLLVTHADATGAVHGPGASEFLLNSAIEQVLADPALTRRKDGRSIEILIEGYGPKIEAKVPKDNLTHLAFPTARIGALPRLIPWPVRKLYREDEPKGWGQVMTIDLPGEQGAELYRASRNGFGADLDVAKARTELFGGILGPGAVNRVTLGFELIDVADGMIRKHDPKFSLLAPDLLTRHLKAADSPPAWWKEAGKLYAGAMDEMYRGIQGSREGAARPILLYHAKRLEFAVHYFAAIEAARLSAVAKQKGDADARVEQAEKATESMYNALSAYGDVARDPSDRALIAFLNEYGYRPLQAELRAAKGKK